MVYRKRGFEPIFQADFLKQLGIIRKAILAAWQRVPFQHPLYKTQDKLLNDIDSIAEDMTGDRTHFHLKPHSTPPPGGFKPDK